jgi:hypothetical protein
LRSVSRRLLAVVVLAAALAACSSTDGPADPTNAVTAYVDVSEDRWEQDSVVEQRTRARDGEPSEPAGFLRGLRPPGTGQAQDGVSGWESIFQSNITQPRRLNVEARVSEIELHVVWLNGNDEWPYCIGVDDCQRVKESGNFL